MKLDQYDVEAIQAEDLDITFDFRYLMKDGK